MEIGHAFVYIVFEEFYPCTFFPPLAHSPLMPRRSDSFPTRICFFVFLEYADFLKPPFHSPVFSLPSIISLPSRRQQEADFVVYIRFVLILITFAPLH